MTIVNLEEQQQQEAQQGEEEGMGINRMVGMCTSSNCHKYVIRTSCHHHHYQQHHRNN
jgi:hypothetical protein